MQTSDFYRCDYTSLFVFLFFFAGKTRKNTTDANILVLSLQSHHYKFFKAFVDFYISLNYFMVKEILTIRIINESI